MSMAILNSYVKFPESTYDFIIQVSLTFDSTLVSFQSTVTYWCGYGAILVTSRVESNPVQAKYHPNRCTVGALVFSSIAT